MGINSLEILPTKDSDSAIITYSSHSFKPDDYNMLNNKFEEIKAVYNIDDDFDDNIWVFYEEFSKYTFKFQYEFNSDINLALKGFCVLQISNKLKGLATALQEIQDIQRLTYMSASFDKNYIEMMEEYLNSHEKPRRHQLAYSFSNFLSYYNENDCQEYLDMLSSFDGKNLKRTRKLPNYKSIISFDYILSDYFLNADADGKSKYFPIMLWWEITRVIPLRPLEFCSIERNCINFNEETNTYTIVVPRLKLRDSTTKALNIKKFDTLSITKEIYDLIEEYKNLTSDDNKYLLSYELYHSYQVERNKGASSFKKYNDKFLGRKQLEYLLESFYKEVIEPKYLKTVVGKQKSYNNPDLIEKLSLGDTRHLAFCSMMLQGFSPLTIARIGGHTGITSHLSYCDHLDIFSEADVEVLADEINRLINHKTDNMNIYNTVFNSRESLVQKMILEKNKEILGGRKIEGGTCFSNNFPFECPPNTNCILCSKFLLSSNDLNFNEKKADALYSIVSKEIEKQIDILRNIFSKSSVDYNDDIIAKQASEQLSRSIAQKSILKAYKIKFMEV